MAALNNHEELVALLLERGADPDVKNEVIAVRVAFSAPVLHTHPRTV